MLLLVAVWIFFMLHFRRVGKPAQQQALEEQKRHKLAHP
jgi:hypothetical protein